MHDPTDNRGIPTSAGVPSVVRYSAIAGLIAIFVIVGMVIATSMSNHVWPSTSTTQLKL